MKSSKITAVISTKNEEYRLPLLIANLRGFSDIMVFDGGSTDGTEKICADNDVQFIIRPPEDRLVVGGDARFVLSHVKTPYVLQVNCSHYYPRHLLHAFASVAEEGKFKAVYHDLVIYSFGQVVHRPFFRRRSAACNFYHISAINFTNSRVHNEAPVEVSKSEQLVLPPIDDYAIHLFRDYDVRKTELNHGFYGDQDSRQRFESGVRTNLYFMIWRPLRYFLYQYIRCGSVCYGLAGFVYALLFAQLELNIQLKIWEMQNGLSLYNISKSNLKKRDGLFRAQFK